MYVYPNYYKKKLYFISSLSIRMSGNKINFDEKRMTKSDFYNNNNKKYFI